MGYYKELTIDILNAVRNGYESDEIAKMYKISIDEVDSVIDMYEELNGPDQSMDGDFDSGMASAGFGTDEDYGYAEDVI
jgi:hypothetical protein